MSSFYTPSLLYKFLQINIEVMSKMYIYLLRSNIWYKKFSLNGTSSNFARNFRWTRENCCTTNVILKEIFKSDKTRINQTRHKSIKALYRQISYLSETTPIEETRREHFQLIRGSVLFIKNLHSVIELKIRKGEHLFNKRQKWYHLLLDIKWWRKKSHNPACSLVTLWAFLT